MKRPNIWVIEEKQLDGGWLPRFTEAGFTTLRDAEDYTFDVWGDEVRHIRPREYQRVPTRRKGR